MGFGTSLEALAKRLRSVLFRSRQEIFGVSSDAFTEQGTASSEQAAQTQQKRRFSEIYRLFCEGSEAEAIRKLGRPLTHAEHLAIWDAGSIMMLESLDQNIAYVETAAEVEQALHSFGKVSKKRRVEDLQGGVEKLAVTIDRPLTVEELEQFQGVDTLYEAMSIVERIIDAEPSQRVPLLHSLLFKNPT